MHVNTLSFLRNFLHNLIFQTNLVSGMHVNEHTTESKYFNYATRILHEQKVHLVHCSVSLGSH